MAARFIPAPDQGGAQLVVLAAELFAEAVVIVLATTTIPDDLADAGILDPTKPGLTLGDDVGTEYRRSIGLGIALGEPGWGSSHGVSRFNLEFLPPVPPQATRLRVGFGRRHSVVLAL